MKSSIFGQPAQTTETETPSALQFIRNDPALCMCPGLFRHLNTADRDYAVALEIDYTHGETRLTVQGPLLSGFDLAMLQAIELAASATRELINGSSTSELVSLMASDTEHPDADDAPVVLQGLAADDDMCYARCSIAQLLRAVGMPVNSHYTQQAVASIKRLAAVTLFVSPVATPSQFQSLRLLSHCAGGLRNRSTTVQFALHPRLTSALVGRLHQDTRMSVEEMVDLGADCAARVLHQRLCALINDGHERKLKVRTLLEYLFPVDKSGITLERAHGRDSKAAYDARRRKLDILAGALATLRDSLQWTWAITTNADPAESIVAISRPAEDWTRSKLRQAAKAAVVAGQDADTE